MTRQASLFALDSGHQQPAVVSVFADDEIRNSLKLLPQAPRMGEFVAFKKYLLEKLPYNSSRTRQRRADYILERFYPDETLDTALTLFLENNRNADALKEVVFYHILKTEPLLARVAAELVFPALPVGRIDRQQLREFVVSQLPGIGVASQRKTLTSIFHSYTLLDVASQDRDQLKFKLRRGTSEAFVYILAAEYPAAGMYSFGKLFESPMHRGLLWDRDWIRDQLYRMRAAGLLSKLSEIDSTRQFSLERGQRESLVQFFAQMQHVHGPDEA